MDIDQLTAFTRIAHEGTFTRAAHVLDLPQPTISGRIRALEAAVGGALFYRQGRKLTLTERGVEFLPYAQRVLELLTEGVERARLAASGQTGRLSIGTMASLAAIPLASAVDQFLRTVPLADLWIESDHSFRIMEMLRDGVIQLGMITAPYLGADLETLIRFQDRLLLVASPAHPLAGQVPLPFERILQEAEPFFWLMYSLELEQVRNRTHTDPGSRVVEIPGVTIRELLLRGTGIGFVTESTVRDDLAAGRLTIVETSDLRPMTRESALVAIAHRDLPASATTFTTLLLHEARRHGLIALDQRGARVRHGAQS